MRIAAGVLIIIAAVLNLIAGIGYAFVGGVVAGGSNLVQQVAQKSNDPAAQEAAAKIGQIGTAGGGGLMAFGFFLLVMCGLGIAGGVVLFMQKAPKFALVVGILQLIAEVIGLVILLGANIITALPGLLAGVFVIIAAIGYLNKPAATAPAPTM